MPSTRIIDEFRDKLGEPSTSVRSCIQEASPTGLHWPLTRGGRHHAPRSVGRGPGRSAAWPWSTPSPMADSEVALPKKIVPLNLPHAASILSFPLGLRSVPSILGAGRAQLMPAARRARRAVNRRPMPVTVAASASELRRRVGPGRPRTPSRTTQGRGRGAAKRRPCECQWPLARFWSCRRVQPAQAGPSAPVHDAYLRISTLPLLSSLSLSLSLSVRAPLLLLPSVHALLASELSTVPRFGA